MAISWVVPVRIAQLLIAFILLGLSAALVSEDKLIQLSQVAFNVFASVWTILVCAFFLVIGLAMSESFLANPIIGLVLDGLTWVFWLAAFASMAAALDNDILFGSTYIHNFQATVAFGVIEWLLFTATLIFVGITGFRGGSKSSAAPAQQGV